MIRTAPAMRLQLQILAKEIVVMFLWPAMRSPERRSRSIPLQRIAVHLRKNRLVLGWRLQFPLRVRKSEPILPLTIQTLPQNHWLQDLEPCPFGAMSLFAGRRAFVRPLVPLTQSLPAQTPARSVELTRGRGLDERQLPMAAFSDLSTDQKRRSIFYRKARQYAATKPSTVLIARKPGEVRRLGRWVAHRPFPLVPLSVQKPQLLQCPSQGLSASNLAQ